MTEITLQNITYKELYDCSYIINDERYGMVSGFMTEYARKTLLDNPNNTDDAKTAMVVALYDGVAVGRNMLMVTKLKAGNDIILVQTGGGYEVNENYRGKHIGTLAFDRGIHKNELGRYLGQLFSTQAISIIQKLGTNVFELPLYYKVCNARPILKAKGLNGLLLSVATSIVELPIRINDGLNKCSLRKLKKKFDIQKLTKIPDWAGKMALNDGHKYMEIHDSAWLQWNLDAKFTGRPEDKQSFYAVFQKSGTPCGFFMTKERVEKEAGIYKDLTRGTIVEWASSDEALLSEADLNLMAISTFETNVDNIITVVSESSSEKSIRRMGFIRHGNYQLVFKAGKEDPEDVKDQTLWRIRYGGCNTIFI